MKKVLFILILSLIVFSCKHAKQFDRTIDGKWKLFKSIGFGNYTDYTKRAYQILREFKPNNIQIIYDANGNETSRCKFELTETAVIFYGEGFEIESSYWVVKDTLQLRNYGGFEYYDEYYVKQ